jgi:hypothetical protein
MFLPEDEADDVEDEDAVINEDAGSNDEVQATTDVIFILNISLS